MDDDKRTINAHDIPMGLFGMDGTWYPNTLLDMNEKQQREWNIKGGHLPAQNKDEE